jgi:hypothetical protein
MVATAERVPSIEALRELPEDDFLELVQADQRGELPLSASKALNDPALAERVYTTLVSIKRDIEAQLTQRAAELLAYQQECMLRGHGGKSEYFAAKTEYDLWRGKAVYAKSRVEHRISAVKLLMKARAQQHTINRDEALLDRKRFLSALMRIAHYDLATNPMGFANATEMADFFQRVAREALDRSVE